MSAHWRTVGQALLLLGVAAALAGRATAAPALKPLPDDGPVDLSAVHQAIEKAKPGADFPEADLGRVKDALARLLARADALENLPAGHARGRKLPTAFGRFGTAEVAEVIRLTQQKGTLAVGRGGRMVQCTGSVLLVAGDAEVIQSHDCVIVAGGRVRVSQSSNCVVVARRSAELIQCFPRPPRAKPAEDAAPEPGGTLAVAGERLKLVQSKVGVGLVLRPGGTKEGPAIESGQCRDLLFLNAPGDWKSTQDTGCWADTPKAPIAK
jgi:hypothetical protein